MTGPKQETAVFMLGYMEVVVKGWVVGSRGPMKPRSLFAHILPLLPIA